MSRSNKLFVWSATFLITAAVFAGVNEAKGLLPVWAALTSVSLLLVGFLFIAWAIRVSGRR